MVNAAPDSAGEAPGRPESPHQGWVTTVYRAHLGLVVSDDCALRVGDETRQWREGETSAAQQ
ncbi:aspartyl/asparaginyl beta-hydroxylase domain-containing protein [Micromonospora sp. NBC_01813]|uniref:aspartyl/asparaginyl beta-hydroxylase domain-containing protein n=1 Tax=Micromonospora sp. NBC_01813 TaxID=2975988 RepID=UPI002DD83773|nr:aspartyl/asparaginyl beta-hydroxylase domain-containing protein [Micromonospora sp. NBC_01813]WSA12815.1 aspartyl/asparaginyl beta-hydroxylase domain-containing protein [Micromonospora sp. NBC_01813]